MGYQFGVSVAVTVGGVQLTGTVGFNVLPDSVAGGNYYGATTGLGLVKMKRLYIAYGFYNLYSERRNK